MNSDDARTVPEILNTLAICNYRSLRQFITPLGRLTLLIGANGSVAPCGCWQTQRGGVIGALAREGGIDSTLWAGPESFSAASTRCKDFPQRSGGAALGVSQRRFGYAIDLGLPVPSSAAFSRDPVSNTECIRRGAQLRPVTLLVERSNAVVRSRRDSGARETLADKLRPFEIGNHRRPHARR